MEATEEPQEHQEPTFYDQHKKLLQLRTSKISRFRSSLYLSSYLESQKKEIPRKFRGIEFTEPTPGDISMQNWTWGNDYRPGTAKDNLVYTRKQLEEMGQLESGGWLGGLSY